jgi:ketosteroid isomerase-like protein
LREPAIELDRIGAAPPGYDRGVPDDAAANAALIDRFYEAFARRDPDAMAACYAPDATFSDPVFRGLRGDEVTAMWRMLCERGADLEIRHRDVQADADTGSAHWDADYTFSTTGRKVHNEIDASFVFRDGLIADHLDSFNLYRWTRQALGPVGVLFGWSSRLQGKLRDSARERLDEYMAGGSPK